MCLQGSGVKISFYPYLQAFRAFFAKNEPTTVEHEFVDGGNSYVFITDNDGSNTSGDDLIELTGVTNLTTIAFVHHGMTIT